MNASDAFDPIRSLRICWKLLTPAGLPLLLGGFLLAVTSAWGDPNLGLKLQRFDRAVHVTPEMAFTVFGCTGLALIVGWIVNSWLTCGMAHVVEKALTTGTADVGQLFDARGRFVDVLLTKLLVFLVFAVLLVPIVGIAMLIGAATVHSGNLVLAALLAVAGLAYLCLIVYVNLGLSLAATACAFEASSPTASIRRSWSLASGNRWTLFVYWIVLAIVMMLGLLACCVGVLFTASFANIAPFESYLALTRPEMHGAAGVVTSTARPDGWGPPPPGAGGPPQGWPLPPRSGGPGTPTP